jgi:capsular polysaccharide biosynthesis protein
MEPRDEIEISLKDILGVLKKNLIFIIVITLIFTMCSFFVTKFFIQKTYTASISLYVDTDKKSENASSSSDLNSYNYAQKLVATYIRMLNTKTFYTELSEELSGKYTANQLNSMISFKDDNETEIFDAYVESSSPAESKTIADAVAEIAPKTISRLNSNAELKIVDYAELPTGASSPNVAKNMMIAFAAGLILSVLIAFIRHFVDKKIKYSEEMTVLGDIPILAAIPNFDNFINEKSSGKTEQ